MRRPKPVIVVFALLAVPTLVYAAPTPGPAAVALIIETTLSSESGHIRQFVFDGDRDTYFASLQNLRRADHFTLVFDKPVTMTSVDVTTGRPTGEDKLDSGILEISRDGKRFEQLVKFTDGAASARRDSGRIRALRIKPAADQNHPLAIRDFAIESDPPLAIFKYPVEFTVKVDDAPEMKPWADKVARICERAYPMINEELKSEGFKPATAVTMALKSDYKGVAGTTGSYIMGSVKYFKAHPDDIGAMVHETVHVCQHYRGKSPGWLVEGIADYIRFYKFEPGKIRPVSPNRARYDGSYQVTAQFLAYLTKKYDREIVRKLNKVIREGEYKEEVFQVWTGKSLQQLGEEWRSSLRR